MKLETKYNINDEVWFLHTQSMKAVQGKIKDIQLHVLGKPQYRRGEKFNNLIRTGEYSPEKFVNIYGVDDMVTKNGCTKSEYDLFETKEQLIKTLTKKIASS